MNQNEITERKRIAWAAESYQAWVNHYGLPVNAATAIVTMELGIVHYFVEIDSFIASVRALLKQGGKLDLNEFHPLLKKAFDATAGSIVQSCRYRAANGFRCIRILQRSSLTNIIGSYRGYTAIFSVAGLPSSPVLGARSGPVCQSRSKTTGSPKQVAEALR